MNVLKSKGFRQISSLLVVVFIFLAIPITIYLSMQNNDVRSKAATNVNDPCFSSGCPGIANSQQWALNKINASSAWDVTHGDSSIKIAVVDTGIRVTPDLVGQVGVGTSFAPVGGTTDDDYGSFGSGTNLASIIGAATNNSRDMAGVVWNTTMLPVKTCDFTSGGCTQDQLAQGINWSVTNGAKIIVTGEFFTSSSANLDAAVANAVNNGVIVVVPAGDNALNNYYPALNNGVISVGATDITDTIGSFSGHNPTIVAPGAGTTAQPGVTFIGTGGCCFVKIGTSKAAAHVAGAAALLLAAGVPASQVKTALIAGAKDLGPVGPDSQYGNGRLDICASLNSAGKTCPVAAGDTTPPSVPTNLSASAVNPTTINLTWTASSDNVGVAGYELFNSSQIKIATVTTTSYSNAGLTQQTQYCYTLKAFDLAGNRSPATNQVCATTPAAPDTTPPTVTLTNPTNASVISKSVNVTVNTSDNVGVVKVEYYVDSSLKATMTSSPYSYSWDTTLTSNGSHTLAAKAFDAAGNVSTSTINLTVDNLAPVVTITSPANGATVQGIVNVTATATDQTTSVTKVEFYVDGVLSATSTTSPYGFSWVTPTSNGPRVIDARAYDSANNIGLSSITVNGANADTTPPSQPTNLVATALAYNQISLTWTAATDNIGVTGYWIVRNGTTVAFTSTNSIVDSTHNPNNPITPSTTYNYQVIAYDAASNNSIPSNTATVTTPAAPDTLPPSYPTNLTASTVSMNQINLSWSASTDNVGVTSYDVYRNGTKIGSPATTSFGDSGLTPSTTYSYYVIARDAAGNSSSASTTATATTRDQVLQSGDIAGTVYSSAGGTVTGAKVISSVGGSKNTTNSDTTGKYKFVNQSVASYTLNFSAKNYKSQTAYITVIPGITIIQNATLIKR